MTVANAKSAYDHISNNGSDHSFINQGVTSGSTPTFSANNFSDGGSKAIVTTTQETNWDSHIADNTQAHTDYLLNSGDDIMNGILTADGITLDEISAPGTPAANKVVIYVDSADGDLKAKDDDGEVIIIANFSND